MAACEDDAFYTSLKECYVSIERALVSKCNMNPQLREEARSAQANYEDAHDYLTDVKKESDINQRIQRELHNSSDEGNCSLQQPSYPIPPPNLKKNNFSMKRTSSQTLSLTQMEERGSKKSKTDTTEVDKLVNPQASHSNNESMLQEVLNGQEKILLQLKKNEELQRVLTASVQRLEDKVDSLIAASSSTPTEETPNLELLQSLPLTLDEFTKLEEKMTNSESMRQQLDTTEVATFLDLEEGFYNIEPDGSLSKDNLLEKTSTPKQDEPLSKKRKLDGETDLPIKEGVIHQALQDNFNGTMAILEYSNLGYLSPQSQQLVAECVLLQEIKGDIEKKITGARFSELSRKIEEYFPSESAYTYYIPYHKDKDNKKHSASGKLVDLLYNIRRRAAKAGIRRNQARKSSVEDITSEDYTESESEELNNILNSLKVSCSPWQDYVEKWSNTHGYRLYLLQKSKRGLQEDKVSSFLKDFKGLKEPLGYTLLELDYKYMYPGSENNLLGNWPIFKKKVIEALNTTLKRPQYSENDSDATVLMNLASLVKPKLIVDKLSTKWKPTREVIQEGFMIHVTSPLDLDSSIQRFRERAAARKESAQPVTVIIGKTLDCITDSYVIFDNLQYRLDSPVKAVDLAFKTYQAIHAEYARHAEPLWLILQLAVYNIRTKWDNIKTMKTIDATVRKLSCN